MKKDLKKEFFALTLNLLANTALSGEVLGTIVEEDLPHTATIACLKPPPSLETYTGMLPEQFAESPQRVVKNVERDEIDISMEIPTSFIKIIARQVGKQGIHVGKKIAKPLVREILKEEITEDGLKKVVQALAKKGGKTLTPQVIDEIVKNVTKKMPTSLKFEAKKGFGQTLKNIAADTVITVADEAGRTVQTVAKTTCSTVRKYFGAGVLGGGGLIAYKKFKPEDGNKDNSSSNTVNTKKEDLESKTLEDLEKMREKSEKEAASFALLIKNTNKETSTQTQGSTPVAPTPEVKG